MTFLALEFERIMLSISIKGYVVIIGKKCTANKATWGQPQIIFRDGRFLRLLSACKFSGNLKGRIQPVSFEIFHFSRRFKFIWDFAGNLVYNNRLSRLSFILYKARILDLDFCKWKIANYRRSLQKLKKALIYRFKRKNVT